VSQQSINGAIRQGSVLAPIAVPRLDSALLCSASFGALLALMAFLLIAISLSTFLRARIAFEHFTQVRIFVKYFGPKFFL